LILPIRDHNPRMRFPRAVLALVLVNTAIYLFLVVMDLVSELDLTAGAIPLEITTLRDVGPHDLVPPPFTILTSMFLHAGPWHLIGNMWFLWIFGDNVEDSMGHVRFVVFYLLCGLAAAGAQMLAAPSSIVPMVGASGAIGGVMGAYALLYPRAHVHMFIFLGFYMTTIAVPAIYMLGYWFLLQLLSGLPGLSGGQLGGVAFWAHVGGFLAGLALVSLFKQRERLEARLGRPARRTARHRWF
jgi:membrane associated rhomboid family serine protease